MKKILLYLSIFLFLILVLIISILTTLGFETNKFNEIISNNIEEKNKNISLNLNKIKFKFDVKNFNLFLETKNPQLIYKDQNIPIKNFKTYLNFLSLIKSKPKVDKVILSSNEIEAEQLKKIITKLKPSNLNSLVVNKVQKGKLEIGLELYFEDNLILSNFIARGLVKNMNLKLNKNLILKKTKFNFFSDATDVLITDIHGEINGILVKKGNLKITKNKEINLKSEFISDIKLDKKNINSFLPYFKNFNLINDKTILTANLKNFLDITFDNTLKVIDYSYKNKGGITNLNLKFDNPVSNLFLEKNIDNLQIKNSDIEFNYILGKKNTFNIFGEYSIDNKNYQNYSIENSVLNKVSNTILNFDFLQKLNFNFINYKKDLDKIAKFSFKFSTDKELVNLKEIKYEENKNLILIEDLKLKKRNFVSLKKVRVLTFENDDIKNDFNLIFDKNIKVRGKKFDANNLNKFLNKKSKNNLLNNLSKNIEIDLKNIETPLSKELKNFRLIGELEKGKFIKISSKGDFGNNKFLDISMKSDKITKKKYLEIYSDLPQPLLSEYSFFKGLSKGVLTFSSIIEDNTSTSKLIIDDFKVINAPGVVKLLSLADFGGLADLAEGDGLSFEKMEINMNNNRGFLKLTELIAVGPSISVLMEGYKEENGLTSLKGTLVPAKNLNKLLSKIPVIGKIIIPSEVGEGLFGVSFKMKGMPGNIKTTINPIKTLTPRFITKVLEKSKKTK